MPLVLRGVKNCEDYNGVSSDDVKHAVRKSVYKDPTNVRAFAEKQICKWILRRPRHRGMDLTCDF